MTTIEAPTIEQVEALAARLTPQARAELIARLARALAESKFLPLPPVLSEAEQIAAIEEAAASYERNPDNVLSNEEVKARIAKLLADLS